MSYDVQVWSVERPEFPDCLPKPESWKAHEGCWVQERRQWQVACGVGNAVLPVDVPEAVSASMPGVSFLTELNLEPIGAPTTGRNLVLRTARSIARAAHGLVYDQQTGELITPRGVKRFVPEARPERFALLELGWWFLSDDIFTAAGLDGFLDILTNLLPEALPKRYGLYEPPQHHLTNEGREHLSAFLLEHLDNHPVLYPHRPVMGLSFACTRERSHPRLGYRCNRVAMGIEASVIGQPGWQEGIRRLWLAVCENLNPFYAEARTLDGYCRMGATYGSNMQTDIHPIRSWFWRGIPRQLGHAFAIGPPYIDLWPQACDQGRATGNLVVLDAGQWTEGNNLTTQAPEGIRQVRTPGYIDVRGGSRIDWVEEYPAIWPFEYV